MATKTSDAAKNDSTTAKGSTTTAKSHDMGQAEVQKIVDAENEQGFRGVEADPTPNEAYTVGGVTKGMATPETDADAFKEAQSASRGKTGIEEA